MILSRSLNGKQYAISILLIALINGGTAAQITFYDGYNFQGDSFNMTVNQGQCTNLPGNWNDRASSISTNDNCILIFTDGDCHGRSTRVAPGTPDHDHLDRINFDKIITSLQLCTPTEQVCGGITVDVDTSEAQDLYQFGQQVKSLMEEWYPFTCRLLESPEYMEVTRISLRFDPKMEGVAGADAFGRSVTGSANYYRDHQDDLGSMIHEMAHIIQRYNKCAGWLTEGIADWTRRMFYEPVKPGKPGPGDNYNNQPVYFINWINEKYPNSLYTLNAECRRGTFEDEIFLRLTGKTPDQLWQDMMNEP